MANSKNRKNNPSQNYGGTGYGRTGGTRGRTTSTGAFGKTGGNARGVNRPGINGRGDNRSGREVRTTRRFGARESLPQPVLCTFSYSGRGFGFGVPVPTENGCPITEDVFIAPRATMDAMTGDLVLVQVYRRTDVSREEGRSLEGEVLSIQERRVAAVSGRLIVTKRYAYVKPDFERLKVLVLVPLSELAATGAKDNDKVEVIPDAAPYFSRVRNLTVPHRFDEEVPVLEAQGHIRTVFGDSTTREANYAAILHESGIRTEFPPYVLQAAEASAAQALSAAYRMDLRDKIIFSIDSASAKDLDDAVSLEQDADGNYVLGVHIADVSHYAPYHSCVEKEARERGTSVYFVDQVVPMLPEALSNEACSLNAGTDKYTLSAFITLDKDGNRLSTAITKGIMRSTVRGVYDEVNDLFANGTDSPYYEKYKAAYPSLADMQKLYLLLREKSRSRGVMELADAEPVILLDETGFPVEIVRRERGDAEKMIEQFMLQANMGVAEVLHAKNLPCLYRIHEEPDKEKLQAFAIFAHNLGLHTFGLHESQKETAKEGLSERLMAILDEARERGIDEVVSQVLLRSMMKAKYVAEPKGHFGLGARYYCHFTSPIRRYPDLFVHNVCTAVLPYTPDGILTAQTPLPDAAFPNTLAKVAPERGLSSSETELTALTAERRIEDLYMALYMSRHIGETFDVMVCSVVKFGIFVQCDNLVEGLVPIASFPDAVVNEAFCTMHAGGVLYTLGSRLQVRLIEADPANGRTTFEPVLHTAENADAVPQAEPSLL